MNKKLLFSIIAIAFVGGMFTVAYAGPILPMITFAGNTHTLGDADIDGSLNVDGTLTGVQILDGLNTECDVNGGLVPTFAEGIWGCSLISGSHIGTDAISSAQINDNTIRSVDINDNTITRDDISDGILGQTIFFESGVNSVPANTPRRILQSDLTSDTGVGILMAKVGTIKNLWANTNGAPPTGYSFEVLINNMVTGITCTVTSNNPCSDLINSVMVNPGDILTILVIADSSSKRVSATVTLE